MQLPFEWPPQSDAPDVDAVVLETKTVEAVIALMASALIAVVRSAEHAEEAGHDR